MRGIHRHLEMTSGHMIQALGGRPGSSHELKAFKKDHKRPRRAKAARMSKGK